MKRSIFLALALTVAGCTNTTVSAIPDKAVTVVNAPVLGNTLADEKALYTATNAYGFVAQSYLTLVKRNQLPASVKAIAKPKVQLLYQSLRAMREAHRLLDSTGFASKLDAFNRLRGELRVLGIGVGEAG